MYDLSGANKGYRVKSQIHLIYLFKYNNRNTRTRCEIYSKLTIKTVNFEHISHHVLVFLLLTLNM